MPNPHDKEERPGIAVDAKGGSVVDPTANVIALNEASDRRQDDLRRAHEKYVEAEIRHVSEMANLSRSYEEKLGVAESKRIDAIRAVDVGAVGVASERQTQQAAVLANQVSASAETLRTLVATTASSVQTALNQMTQQLTDRIALLEKSSYEGKGKEAVSDPMLSQMVNELKALRTDVTTSAGKGQGMDKMWGYLVAAAGSGGIIAWIIGKAAQ